LVSSILIRVTTINAPATLLSSQIFFTGRFTGGSTFEYPAVLTLIYA
jgi:hypothetical protein